MNSRLLVGEMERETNIESLFNIVRNSTVNFSLIAKIWDE